MKRIAVYAIDKQDERMPTFFVNYRGRRAALTPESIVDLTSEEGVVLYRQFSCNFAVSNRGDLVADFYHDCVYIFSTDDLCDEKRNPVCKLPCPVSSLCSFVMRFSPCDKYLLIWCEKEQNVLEVWHVAEKRLVYDHRTITEDLRPYFSPDSSRIVYQNSEYTFNVGDLADGSTKSYLYGGVHFLAGFIGDDSVGFVADWLYVYSLKNKTMMRHTTLERVAKLEPWTDNRGTTAFLTNVGTLVVLYDKKHVWTIVTGSANYWGKLVGTPWRNIFAELYGRSLVDIHDLFGYIRPFLLDFLFAQLPFPPYVLLQIFDTMMAEEQGCGDQKAFSEWMHFDKISFVQKFLATKEELASKTD